MRYFTLILLLISLAARSQIMQGTVTDAATGRPLSAVTVVNKGTQQISYTDENGFYIIAANSGDIIIFSCVGYKTTEKIKTVSVLVANADITMIVADYILPEFRFNPHHLTQYQLDSIERVQTYKIPLQRRHPSPIMSPASAIAEKFSKRAKQVYQFQKNFAAGEQEKFIDTRYTPQLVAELTGLTGDSVGHFMYACPMPYDFARAGSDLELKVWIREKYREWASKKE